MLRLLLRAEFTRNSFPAQRATSSAASKKRRRERVRNPKSTRLTNAHAQHILTRHGKYSRTSCRKNLLSYLLELSEQTESFCYAFDSFFPRTTAPLNENEKFAARSSGCGVGPARQYIFPFGGYSALIITKSLTPFHCHILLYLASLLLRHEQYGTKKKGAEKPALYTRVSKRPQSLASSSSSPFFRLAIAVVCRLSLASRFPLTFLSVVAVCLLCSQPRLFEKSPLS